MAAPGSWLSRMRGRTEQSPQGRRLVVGDIHGCSRTFRALMEQELAVTSRDQLFLLGDLVSKGPDSIGVLRYLESLQCNGVTVTIIRGNHEEAILRARSRSRGELREMLQRTRNLALLDEETGKDLDPRWLQLFSGSAYVLPLDDAILVHGGIDLSRPDPFSSGVDIVNRRDTVYRATVAGDRPVIHGHTRAALSTIIERLVQGSSVLPLDNGAVGGSNRRPFKVSEYGNLCCLDLDRWTLHVQPNRDVRLEQAEPAFSLRIQSDSFM